MTVNEMREEYRRIRNRSHARTEAEFDAAVARLVTARRQTTPEAWLAAAREVQFPCRECCGTGDFITGTVNGKPTGPGGAHYRCNGKGVRNVEDERRNYGYDIHRQVA